MKKVLIVDDDESILDAVSLLLMDEGYHVDTTPKGYEVHEKVASFKPEIILLDVLMSGSDGRIICKSLKESLKTKNIPVIMMSAHPMAHQSAIDAGADDFLAKPFETEDLLQKLSSV